MDDHIHEIARALLFGAQPAPTHFASANLFGSPPSSRPPRGRPLIGHRILFPPPILSVVGPEWWVYDHEGGDEAMQAFVSSSSERWIRTSDDGWMEKDQYELLGDLGVVANRNSWRAPDIGKCWFVFLQFFQAHAQEGFLSGTFLRNTKQSFDGPSNPLLIHVKDGPCLLVGQAGKMYMHCGDVSASMMRCAGYNYTHYSSRRC